MAIGRKKSNTRILGLIILIFTILAIRLIWVSVQSLTVGSRGTKLPETYHFRVNDYRVFSGNNQYNAVKDFEIFEDIGVEEEIIVINSPNSDSTKNDEDVPHQAMENTRMDTYIMAKVDKTFPQHSTKKPTTAANLSKASLHPRTTIKINVTSDSNEKSSRTISVSTKEGEKIDTLASNNGKITIQATTETKEKPIQDLVPIVKNNETKISNKAYSTFIIKNATSFQQENIQDQTKDLTKLLIPTNTSKIVVVTDGTEDVVVFTKEQLNYGSFIDNEARKENLPSTNSSVLEDRTNGNTIEKNLLSKGRTSSTQKQKSTDIFEEPNKNSKHRIVVEVPLSDVKSVGQCQKIIPWGQKYHAQISTFDLPKKGNYTLIDKIGNYPIPVKSVAEVTKPETLEPVTVILVPFSHADPGYGLTIEQYYYTKTHSTLNNMITKLLQYPELTFQWAETVYLARWFEDLTEDRKENVRQLIDRGQLEIVLGGWVMPDEASSRYVGVVDQLIEGHQWLIENLGVKPKNAWVNDPFGYSSTMPYLWKSSGMDNLVFLRINQAVKAQLMTKKSMDFNWRPYWKTDNSSDMLSSLMAYTNYWIGDVCSPDRDTCNEFGFIHLDEKKHRAIEVTDENLETQAKKLYNMLRVTTDLYKFNTLYLGLGEDFTYVRAAEWDNLFKNYDKLIKYINSKDEWKMQIKFGNLTEYFNHVKTVEREKVGKTDPQNKSEAIPTISGDFFPYTERNHEYWTGYYTTRPLNKRFSREIESLVHAADVFNVMLYSIFKYYNVRYESYKTVAENLRIARRELGMFLHHDGITGTSVPHVVRDFEARLMKAHGCVQTAMKTVLATMLTKGSLQSSKLLQEETVKLGARSISRQIILQVDAEENKLVLVNPTGRHRKAVVSVFASSNNVKVVSPRFLQVAQQISMMKSQRNDDQILVSFEAMLPAYGVEMYKVVPLRKDESSTFVQESILDDIADGSEETLSIENPFMTVILDKSSGMIKRIVDRNGNTTEVNPEFLVYRSARSGAYIFGPEGPASRFRIRKATVKVTKGHLMSEVKVRFSGFSVRTILYNTTGIQGKGVYIKTEVDMKSAGMKNMEVVLRFSTSVKNGLNFFTDQNGYQMMGRETNPGGKIESNYYPVTTMAILEDEFKRFTLHCKQPHGSASLQEGQLEVMLDRHTYRDDDRGLGQGVYDNVNVNSDFVLQIEYKDVPTKLEEPRYTYPTREAAQLNEALQNSVLIYSVMDNNIKILDKIHPLKDRQIPCDVTVVGLRNLVKNNLDYNGTSLVLHRHSFKCGYQSSTSDCGEMNEKLTIKTLLPKLKANVKETTLSHLHTMKQCDMYTDLRPDHMELRSFKLVI